MKRHTILVVDDKPDNLKIIVDFLKESGTLYTILKAPNGKIACKLAEKKLPDLIITDWEMPEMDGIETIRYLKAKQTTKDIPIIMATGVMTSVKNLETALEAGAIDYIRKPIDKIELTARVNSSLKLSESYKEIISLNATKDKFFSIIAHDLRSPFNAMLGMSQLLFENFDSFEPSYKKQFIGDMHQSLQKLYRLLDNLLMWSRSQRGDVDFNPEQGNLRSLTSESIEQFKQAASIKLITLNNEITNDILLKVDKNMFSTIIRNLISNAIKFTPKEGIISIHARNILDENEHSFVEICIKDDGVGISPDRLDELFEMTENTTTKGTENESGTGLGLLLCKEFVEMHGGKIWVQSEVGKGSSFYINFPLFNS